MAWQDDLSAAIEPLALFVGGTEGDREQSLCSIAISMKRIADALTGEGVNIFTAPINSYGEGIGDAIQGQLVRGQAGISQYERR